MLEKNGLLRLGAAVLTCAASAASHASAAVRLPNASQAVHEALPAIAPDVPAAPQSLTVTASGTSYELAGLAPNPVSPSTLSFTITGATGPQYVSAKSDSTDFPATASAVSNNVATVTLRTTLAPSMGLSRAGQVTVRVCADLPCAQVEWSQVYPYAYNQFLIDNTPLALTGYEGAVNAPVHLSVKPGDTGNRLAVATSTSPAGGTWLSANHNTASNIAIDVSGVGLKAGSFSGRTTVSLKQAPTTTRVIPVSFTVGDGIVAPALADMTLQRATTAADLRATAHVNFRGGQSPAWTAHSDQSWLVLDTASGVGDGLLKYHVDVVAAAAAIVDWDSALAAVTLHANGLTDARSTMTLHRELPEITMLTPSQVVMKQGATLALWGRGLSQVTDISQITVGGQPVASGSVLSDTQAIVQMPAQSAGALLVGVANASKAPSTMAQVAIAKGDFANASIPAPANDSKDALVYDPSRKAAFAVSYYGSTLQRFQWQNGTWDLTAVPWAKPWRLQMSPDRSTLYVIDSGALNEVDPDTLKLRVRHAAPNGETFYRGFYFDGASPLTNDLRLWMPDGTEFFDMRHRTFGDASASFAGVGASDLVATPDGAHIYSTEGYYEPPPPNGWYSTASHTTKPLPTGLLNFYYRASFDAQGILGVFDGSSVYRTADWTLVGNLVTSAGEFNYSEPVMSPDGRRVYAPAGPSSGSGPNHFNVYDTTALQPGTSNLVLLGTIPVSNPAVLCSGQYECDPDGRLVIDPIGSTLFWSGNHAFTVVAIPNDLRSQVGAGGGAVRAAAQGEAAQR